MELRKTTREERLARIRDSQLTEKLTYIKFEAGMEWFLNTVEYTQDEKDYVLFHLNQLKEISKFTIHEFREKVEIFKRELDND